MSRYTLHAKSVTRIDLRKLMNLSAEVPELVDACRTEFGWLTDPSYYEHVPRMRHVDCPKTRVKYEHVRKLYELGNIRPIPAADVMGPCDLFLVPEHHKSRWRPIKHTWLVNEHCGPDTVTPMHFPSKKQICELVNQGEFFLSLDFSAYYDQFEYSPEVGSRFCFQSGGRFWALSVLGMGQRQAVQVAMAATRQLLNFKHRSRVEIVIDNVVFVGSKEDVMADAREFVARCEQVHAQLNEDTSKLEEHCVQVGDWCGVHLDTVNKTVSLTQKSLDKTELSWQRRGHWTWRGFAAHVGLLFWSWGIIEAPVCEFFGLLAFLSKVSRMLTENPDQWDSPATIIESAQEPLRRWTELVIANKPRVVPVAVAPERLVCVDASRWGWGYVALNTDTSEIRAHGAPWTWRMEQLYGEKLGQSTFAEPQGLVNALRHLVTPSQVRSVRVGTDNAATRWSFERGYSSHSLDMNAAISRLNSILPGVQITFTHVAGKINVADALSRGGSYQPEQLQEVGESLTAVVGL